MKISRWDLAAERGGHHLWSHEGGRLSLYAFSRDSKSCWSTNEYKCRHLLFTLYDLKSAYISPLPTLAGIVPMHDISNRPLSPACRSETLMLSWLDEYVGRFRTSLMLLVGFEAVRGGSFKCRRILWNVFKAFLCGRMAKNHGNERITENQKSLQRRGLFSRKENKFSSEAVCQLQVLSFTASLSHNKWARIEIALLRISCRSCTTQEAMAGSMEKAFSVMINSFQSFSAAAVAGASRFMTRVERSWNQKVCSGGLHTRAHISPRQLIWLDVKLKRRFRVHRPQWRDRKKRASAEVKRLLRKPKWIFHSDWAFSVGEVPK